MSNIKRVALPFQNYDLAIEDRVADLVSRFTLEEKIELMETAACKADEASGVRTVYLCLSGDIGLSRFRFLPQTLSSVIREETTE